MIGEGLIGVEEVARAIQDADLGGKPLPSVRPVYIRLGEPAISAHLEALRAAGYVVVPRHWMDAAREFVGVLGEGSRTIEDDGA